VVLLAVHAVLYAAILDRACAILLLLRTSGDIEAHAQIASICIRENMWPANPAVYFLVALFGGWHAPPAGLGDMDGIEHLSYVLINVLLVAVLAKIMLTRHILFAEWRRPPRLGTMAVDISAAPSAAATVGAVALLVAFSLPLRQDQLYLGQFPPTVWHNSTTIALAPLALLLFYCSYRFLQAPTPKLAIATAGLCIANVLVKPSFMLPFLMVFPLYALAHFRFSRGGRSPLLWAAGICVLCVGVLALQTYYTYYHAPLLEQFYRERYQMDTIPEERVEVSWFTIWHMYSTNLPLSLLCSIAFPLTYALLFPVKAARDALFRYGAGIFAAAVLLTCMLAETGYRRPHANFFWQTILANYTLFVATLVSLFRPEPAATLSATPATTSNSKWQTLRRGLVLVVLGAQVWAGLAYVNRVLATGQYQ